MDNKFNRKKRSLKKGKSKSKNPFFNDKQDSDCLADNDIVENETKSEFLSSLNREIRTPLNAIIGFCDILLDEALTNEQCDYVGTIRKSGEHVLELINDMLDFSRIEAGQMDVQEIDCSLEKLLARVESLMRSKADEKGLDFSIKKDNEVPLLIRTDPSHLTQCLINLIGNSIKFTSSGHVFVNVSLEEVSGRPNIRFDVEDTGMGIPPEKQERVFELFTQADRDISRRFGGTGLGLAITKQLAELVGGGIVMTSEEGKGTVFSLIIPANVVVRNKSEQDGDTAWQESVQEESHLNHVSFRGSVLVAEDALTNQVLMKSLLSRMGLEVSLAEDGEEALEKAGNEKYDLIIMDMQMPKMDGYEVTRKLRSDGCSTPIVALTANAARGDDEKCINAGCTDYIAKPVYKKLLVEVLARYLPSGQKVPVRVKNKR